MATPKVLVFGATGTQGGAVARQLRAIGWKVHAITRDADSAAAQSLTALGVYCHRGHWDDETVLEAAMDGCHAVFLVLTPSFHDFTAEVTAGKKILRIAKAAGVQHVVYSTGLLMKMDDPNHLANVGLQAKLDLEQDVRTLGFPRWTILRPAFFMANYLSPKVDAMYPGATETGVFTYIIPPDTVLPMIDHEDIAAFAVAALQQPDRFHGQTIDLVSEPVTVANALELIRRGTGRNIRGRYLVDKDEIEKTQAANLLLGIQTLLLGMADLADMDKIRSWGVPLGTFERFVARERAAFDETYRNVKE